MAGAWWPPPPLPVGRGSGAEPGAGKGGGAASGAGGRRPRLLCGRTVAPPSLDRRLGLQRRGLGEAGEDVAVEALVVAVLPWRARRDVERPRAGLPNGLDHAPSGPRWRWTRRRCRTRCAPAGRAMDGPARAARTPSCRHRRGTTSARRFLPASSMLARRRNLRPSCACASTRPQARTRALAGAGRTGRRSATAGRASAGAGAPSPPRAARPAPPVRGPPTRQPQAAAPSPGDGRAAWPTRRCPRSAPLRRPPRTAPCAASTGAGQARRAPAARTRPAPLAPGRRSAGAARGPAVSLRRRLQDGLVARGVGRSRDDGGHVLLEVLHPSRLGPPPGRPAPFRHRR